MSAAARMAPIIFTDALCEQALKTSRYSGRLLHKWARLGGERGDALRAQLERCAAIVPEAKRRRVLGPITGKGSTDDQVRGAVEGLLLAKTLHDHGWTMEFEPEVSGKTPDLRIEKNGGEFFVELRRVAAPTSYPSNEDFDRLKDACGGLWTRTPVRIRGLRIDGQASLKQFRSYLEQLLQSHPSPGRYSFPEDEVKAGVYVSFEVLGEVPGELPAIFSCQYSPVVETPKEKVRACIDEKLGRYSAPLIVALHFYDYAYAFKTVEEVLLGSEFINVPIRFDDQKAVEAPILTRAHDSMLLRHNGAGERARERLEGVLSFFVVGSAAGAFDVCARMYGNPHAEPPRRFAEFAPMLRLVVVESDADTRRLAHLGVDDVELDVDDPVWWHSP